MTETMTERPPAGPEWVEECRSALLLTQLKAGGWEMRDDGYKWEHPDVPAAVYVTADEGQPFRFHLKWSGAAAGSGTMDTSLPRFAHDVLVSAKLLPPPPRLTVTDVAATLAAEVGRDVKPGTVMDYLDKSKPGRRYADTPFPAAEHTGTGRGAHPSWHIMDLPEIVSWRRLRPRFPRP